MFPFLPARPAIIVVPCVWHLTFAQIPRHLRRVTTDRCSFPLPSSQSRTNRRILQPSHSSDDGNSPRPLQPGRNRVWKRRLQAGAERSGRTADGGQATFESALMSARSSRP